jgi:hypothetical protein
MKKLLIAIIIGTMLVLSLGCNAKLSLKDTSNGNLLNNGILVRDQDLLFFSDRLNNRIYTLNANNTGFKEFLKSSGEYLNINDGILYFVSGNAINSAKEDGLGLKKIYESKDKIQWMKNRAGWIYYLSGGSFNELGEDGKNLKTLFKDDNICNVNLSGDIIFYTINNVSQGTSSIISYELSKNKRTIIKKDLNGEVAQMIFQNNFLYYNVNNKVSNIKSTLNVLDLRNKENEVLEASINHISGINVSKQWIYFVDESINGKKVIRRINTITKSKEDINLTEIYEVNQGFWQLSNKENYEHKSFDNVNVLGNWIFFNDGKLKNQINGIKLR